ncbi:MAG: gp26 family baseplate hub assembly chaperone [Candidatus Thiodiazotropha taylori]|uniref:Gp26 family baseplate hub assembly chaperone n=1 Tax=Candidatus Thiodiazotropha taylori TaxID=2792791 RepID=A0A9E4K9B5_9GAMM|nr:gp26 family baseplate hub assembly chaperone [Candidatus Thiodiazotropha taylori]MCW4254985.1 gp26 family baseplate hub assembly chaperone [Candidatus Thiodiazotropha taylori]
MSQLKNIKTIEMEYDDTIPSTGERVKLTPFRVGDEKVLLAASESKDSKQMANAMIQVIDNCVRGITTPLAHFDYEYLFLKLRSISVGEVAEVQVQCKHCETMNPVSIDLSKIKVHKNDSHSRVVKINQNLGFEMKYPNIEEAASITGEGLDAVLDTICKSVTKVYHGDETIDISPAEVKDLKELLESLTSSQFTKFQDFFETMPKLYEEVNFTCSGCSTHNEQRLEGLQSFF